ncbi:tyrosine-type recombinase/integrase [Sphingomonas sp. 28-63-12]|uniref:tyrosine-type recombinase/integrase n=1 Tax=Sphingomonas sp. 28-63-12 TaxID=1970434 RepID=UPI0035A8521A
MNIKSGRQTFKGTARAWHENSRPQCAKVHAADIIRSLERDVSPSIGTRQIGQLTPPLGLGVLRAIEAAGPIATAKLVRQRISAVFVYVIAEGIAQTDRAEKRGAIRKRLHNGRQSAIVDLVPLRTMIITAGVYYARTITRLAMRFLVLTAVCPSGLRGAVWAGRKC